VDDRNMGFALGAADYMTKPVDRDQLVAVLNKHRRDRQRHPVLLIEDEAETRDLIRRVLEKENWEVVPAENGRIGLQRLADSSPSLILLDLMMPEMDGFQFIDELRQHDEWRSIPIVVITAKELDAEERGRLTGSVEAILQKGTYSLEELLGEVRHRVTACAGGFAAAQSAQHAARSTDAGPSG
jgi:CheY-like chemotaxis protein